LLAIFVYYKCAHHFWLEDLILTKKKFELRVYKTQKKIIKKSRRTKI